MKEEKRILLWTVIVAVLLCLELILVTLTPFAKIGNGTRFNSEGMYANLTLAGGSYLVPLVLYFQKVKSMKYVIAVVNGIWLISQPVIIAIALQWIKHETLEGKFICGISAIIAIITFVTEILWYYMCRRRRI